MNIQQQADELRKAGYPVRAKALLRKHGLSAVTPVAPRRSVANMGLAVQIVSKPGATHYAHLGANKYHADAGGTPLCGQPVAHPTCKFPGDLMFASGISHQVTCERCLATLSR